MARQCVLGIDVQRRAKFSREVHKVNPFTAKLVSRRTEVMHRGRSLGVSVESASGGWMESAELEKKANRLATRLSGEHDSGARVYDSQPGNLRTACSLAGRTALV